MKMVKAVKPYIYKNQLNFKDKACTACKAPLISPQEEGRVENSKRESNKGIEIVSGIYPRWLHKVMFNVDMPNIWSRKWFQMVSKGLKLILRQNLGTEEARLVFVQPVTLYFDTFFVAPFHEMIPFIWDCWPKYDDMMVKWLKRHKVKVAIITSSQSRERIQARLPELKTLYCPEGIDTESYGAGKELKDRKIDLLEFGRGLNEDYNFVQKRKTKNDYSQCQSEEGKNKTSKKDKTFSLISDISQENKLKHVRTKDGDKLLYSESQLHELMEDAKVTICLPRSMTDPELADGVETLTQRYWEAMLSRMVIVGHAPKELVDLIGYNPVVEVSGERLEFSDEKAENTLTTRSSSAGSAFSAENQITLTIQKVLEHIEYYQELVNKNRETALKFGDWKLRMGMVKAWLDSNGYGAL